MAMLDSFFNKGVFKGAKCKTLLKLTIPRIKLLRNRREIQLKQMRRDIAKLLENGQEATARIRVEHIIREENLMEAQEIIELFCELITVRLPIIETQRECPLDLKEAIASMCFAAPRCSDLPELLQIQIMFSAKYGKEFVAAATELMPDCGVNRQIIEKLSVRAPSVEAKMKLLKEIAQEHDLDWDPVDTESELLKPHEDLLNGPSYFGGTTLPLPKEKTEESLSAADSNVGVHEEGSFDEGFTDFDLPEVPKASVRPTTLHSDSPLASSLETGLGTGHEAMKRAPGEDLTNEQVSPVPSNDATAPAAPANETKQFTPFVSLPTTPPPLVSTTRGGTVSTAPADEMKQFTPFVSLPSAAPPLVSTIRSGEAPSFTAPFLETRSEPATYLTQAKNCSNEDLQDVLAAARVAAETADRAAAAARAASSLAQVKITELIAKRGGTTASEGIGNTIPDDGDVPFVPSEARMSQEQTGSPDSKDHITEPHSPLYQRTASLDDDPYFSYPNLFSKQGLEPNLKPGGPKFPGDM